MSGLSLSKLRQLWSAEGMVCAWAMLMVALACAMTPAGPYLHHQLQDALLKHVVSPVQPAQDIVVVTIDADTLSAMGHWPWAPAVHASIIEKIRAAGASTIVYTPALAAPVLSPDELQSLLGARPSLAAVRPEALQSKALAVLDQWERDRAQADQLLISLQQAGNVGLTYPLVGAQLSASPIPKPPAYIQGLSSAQALEHAAPAAGAAYPADRWGRAAAFVGYIDWFSDSSRVLRSTRLVTSQSGQVIASAALLAAAHHAHYGASNVVPLLAAGHPSIRVGSLPIPTQSDGSVSVRWYPSSAQQTPFKTVSLMDIVSDKVPPQTLLNQTVIVGLTPAVNAAAGGLTDIWGSPVSSAQALATVLSNIRQEHVLVSHPLGAAGQQVVMVITLLCLGLLWWPRASNVAVVASAVAWAGFLVLFQYVLLSFSIYAVDMSIPVGMAMAGLGVVGLMRAGHAGGRVRSGRSLEMDRAMGLALYQQGQYEMAFELLRRVPAKADILDALYEAAQALEHKQDYVKAKAVYKYILQNDAYFKDVRKRYKANKAQLHADSDSVQPVDAAHSVDTQFMDSSEVAVDLGRYVLGREVGHGSMGVVYEGYDPYSNQEVAIKTLALSDEFEGDSLAEAQARFFHEAETAGRLQHPHIVAIYDAGQARGLAYIAMEFVAGHDLSRHATRNDLLPVDQVISIAIRVAQALDYAHAHNVVHRDIKPSNIMFDAEFNAVKVMDFGIARITDATKTKTGLVMGTPSFMSPEQLAGARVDGRSDIYSLGATIFQLLTGSAPLMGATIGDLMVKIANEPAPDIRILRPEISEALAGIIAKALQKSPLQRYQTGKQLADALIVLITSDGGHHAP